MHGSQKEEKEMTQKKPSQRGLLDPFVGELKSGLLLPLLRRVQNDDTLHLAIPGKCRPTPVD
jgi:hypothetical protein